MTAFKLSPSTLNLLKECPRCFWLSEHEVWSRPNGIFPSLPSGMDGILKKHFDKFMEKGKLPPELCSKSECENLKLFDNKDLLKEWRNSRKGLWFEDKEGNILHGGIDNLMVNKVKDHAYLLFYHQKEVLETGEVVFNTDLKKMKITPEHAEKLFNKAIKMLGEDCPKQTCVWCEKV